MPDTPDERTKVDRTSDPEDPAKDAREEYTAYRDQEPDRARSDKENADEEARREADLQPGTPESDEEDAGER